MAIQDSLCTCGSELEMFAETMAAWVPFDMQGRRVNKEQVIQTAFFDCRGCGTVYFSYRYGRWPSVSDAAPYSNPVLYRGELIREEIFGIAFNCRGILSGSDEGAVIRARIRKAKA